MAEDIKCLISLYICKKKSPHQRDCQKRKEYKRIGKTKDDVASKIITK